MRISDWSSDVCSSDLLAGGGIGAALPQRVERHDPEVLGENPKVSFPGEQIPAKPRFRVHAVRYEYDRVLAYPSRDIPGVYPVDRDVLKRQFMSRVHAHGAPQNSDAA